MKIIKYKKIKNKYRVFFDNDLKIDLNDNIILKYELLLKKEIDQKLFDEIVLANNKENIYEHALKYINIKIRSKEEIYNYLNKKGYEKEEINNVIIRLEKNNLINDDLYIKSYIHDRFYLSSDGPYKIKNNLLSLKLDESKIDDYLIIDKNELLDKLNKLVDKKIKSYKNYSGNILKMRLINYFIDLGYSKNDIEEVLNGKNLINIDNGIKEYNKLFIKYSKKYEGYELENILRNKLYQKGYDLNEIKKNID